MKLTNQLSGKLLFFVLFLAFVGISFLMKFTPGMTIGKNFKGFTSQMVLILPPIFVLIGLFDVWVKKETIIKHLGKDGSIMSYVWVFILAAPMAGGLLPGFPIAYSLYQKGARLSVVLAFLGAIGVGRVPMIFFESTFLGWQFSVVRIAVSVPLVVITSIIMGKILEKNGYTLQKGL